MKFTARRAASINTQAGYKGGHALCFTCTHCTLPMFAKYVVQSITVHSPKRPDLSNRTPWIDITTNYERKEPRPKGAEPISPHVSRPFWRDQNTHKQYVDWLGKRLGYNTMEDWYNVEKIDITSTGGTHLLTGHYHTSPVRLLMQIYPSHEWEPWKFKFIANPLENIGNPQVYKVNQDRFFSHVEKHLKIKDMSDWYKVPPRQLKEVPGHQIIKKMGGLQDFLKKVYPSHTWDAPLFEATLKRGSQRWLRVLIEELLPNSTILEDYQHPDLKYENSKDHLQFDIFLPQSNTAIEYQGPHHYGEVYYFGAQKFVKERDIAKRKICAASGIKLIEIPYWWDNERSSLHTTLHKLAPTLFPSAGTGVGIPDKAPQRTTSTGAIRPADVFTLPEDWDSNSDPTGWLLCEGFEGFRVYWDGEALHSRKHELKNTPKSFLDLLPPEPLDGFLRGPSYETRDAISLAKSSNPVKWSKVVFHVMDAPFTEGPLETRIAHVKSLCKSPQLKAMEYKKCTGESDMLQFYEETMAKGGEGVFLRQAGSKYERGRTKTFCRIKEYEETVVKYLGKNAAAHKLSCELPNGIKCNVSCPGQTYDRPQFKEGDVLQIRHSGENPSGIVSFPCFVKVMTGAVWEDAKKEALQAQEKAKKDKEERRKSADAED